MFDSKNFKYKFNLNGNIKLGSMAVWSTLKGATPIYIQEMGKSIVGTCGNCADCEDACYVNASYRYPSVKYSHARNTLGLRECPQKVFADLDDQLTFHEKPGKKPIELVRINQSGELENNAEFESWVNLALKHEGTRFYIYTKRYDIVSPYIKENGLPKNFHVLYSVWHNTGKAEYEEVKDIPGVHAFVYDDGVVGIKPDVYCPAYKDGKLDHEMTCNKCGLCFKSKVKAIGCHAH